MARIRTVKPEFWRDEKVVMVKPLARLLFIGMFNFANDEGVLKRSPMQLKIDVFPMDTSITIQSINEMLHQLEREQLITTFEADYKGTRQPFIEISGFNTHQKINRPTPSDFPKKPKRKQGVEEPSVSPHGELTPGREGKGEEGRGEEGNKEKLSSAKADPNPLVRDFESWWKAYPNRRKTGKPQVMRKWLALAKGGPDGKLLPLEAMLAALERHKRSRDWLKEDGEFIPGPHRYLNELRFTDTVDSSAAPSGPRYPPAPLQITPENAHQYADPDCPECHGKGLTYKDGPSGVGPMRVQCSCTNKKFNKAKEKKT